MLKDFLFPEKYGSCSISGEQSDNIQQISHVLFFYSTLFFFPSCFSLNAFLSSFKFKVIHFLLYVYSMNSSFVIICLPICLSVSLYIYAYIYIHTYIDACLSVNRQIDRDIYFYDYLSLAFNFGFFCRFYVFAKISHHVTSIFPMKPTYMFVFSSCCLIILTSSLVGLLLLIIFS